MLKKLLSLVFEKPLPSPSRKELGFLSELRMTFRDLPILDAIDASPSEAAWLNNMNRLRELVLSQDPREFLRWDVISQTMFVGNARYILTELKYLKRRSDWNARWCRALKESRVGRPIPCVYYSASSGTLIHHAYHVAQFEERTGVQVRDIDFVFEFGGGYGSMCRLFYNLGFSGRYIIFDLAPFSMLQRYFLGTIGLPVKSSIDIAKSRTGIACISDLQELTALRERIEANERMFVATWSVSECPIEVRDLVLPMISDFGSILIAYQDTFGEVNNVQYFDRWKEFNTKFAWHSWRIEHLPGNNYLVGRVGDAG
ncbi:MAG TPA: hypothetical protein VGR01_00775 [Burkholderiales bacterium]|jgi:hypothetical protein|nr:hypothetical protein [Burkholderiales bacterium]